MPKIELKDITKLRQQTGAGMMDCKKALSEANGNYDQAVKILRKKGQEIMAKKAGREAHEGIIDCYVHANKKIAAMVEVSCETDFVARNQDFKNMAHEIAMQIAASNPLCISEKDMPQAELDEQKKICQEEIAKLKKPANIAEKIMQGKIKKYCQDVCLLTQPLVKDPDKTVQDLITETTAKLGEKMEIKKFIRYEI